MPNIESGLHRTILEGRGNMALRNFGSVNADPFGEDEIDKKQ